MRGALRWIGWTLAIILGPPLIFILLAVVVANSRPGRDWIERALPEFTDGKVVVAQLDGRFPDAPRIGHIVVADTAGPWFAIDDAVLDWSPMRLLTGKVDIRRLAFGHIAVSRLPAPSSESESSGGFSLPVGILLRELRVERLDLAQPVAGLAAALAIDASAEVAALDRGTATLSIRRLNGEGDYGLQGRIDPASLHVQLKAREPASGLLASLAQLPQLGALTLDAAVDGPYSALDTQFDLSAGPLRAKAQGSIDVAHSSADIAVTATAPAMRPRPDLSWQSVALDAKIHGPFARPNAWATFHIAALSLAGAAIPEAHLELRGDAGAMHLQAGFKGTRIPGPSPDLLRAGLLSLEADAKLDTPDRPVNFAVKHPLLSLEGKALASANPSVEASLKLPDLAPWAAAGGLDLKGTTQLTFKAAQTGDTVQIDAEDKLAIGGGMAPLPALVGDAAKLVVSMAVRGSDIKLARLRFDGKALNLAADGTVSEENLALNYKLALPDLAALVPDLTGKTELSGQISGLREDFGIAADLTGVVAAKGLPRGPLAAKIRLQGLPKLPVGQVTAQGMLNGSPLQLAVGAQPGADGGLRIAIDRADWKSAHAEGALNLPKGASVPIGKVDLRMTRVEDLRALVGQPLTGSFTASLDATEREARLNLDARGIGLVDTAQVEHAALAVTVADPLKHPLVDGLMTLDGIGAGNLRGSARLTAEGAANALDVGLSADLKNLAGADAQASSAARLDIPARLAVVSRLQADWKQETLRLLEPSRIDYGGGLKIDRLRLGLRDAVLEVDGRAAPALDLDVALRGLPADLAGLFVPGLSLDGSLRAEARLSGTTARPFGAVSLEANGVHPRAGAGRALPPINLVSHLDLAGTTAQVDSRLQVGQLANLSVTGQAPLTPGGEFDLHANGRLDMKILDPLLMAEGRRVRGQIALVGALSGNQADPNAQGSLEWNGGEVQDFTQGLHLSDIAARLQADGDTIRIAKFQGRAGPGTVALEGGLGLAAQGFPINLKLTARNAQPLASDRLTVKLNADLDLKGQATGQLDASGMMRVQRAEIRIPESLPTSIAVLDVRRPGEPPPPPPKPGPRVGLDLTINAPNQIFVRGRGLDAELGGTVRLRGDSNQPRPEGHFEMRRGEFSLAGKTLVFSKGVIGFNGGNLADPALDFAATSISNNVTATLGVGGTARKPKITLSSTPELPPDEVLAQLLFGHATASLSPFEMVQIASAVASLTGITAGVNPLETVRRGLGLDRLALGGGTGGAPSLEAGRYVTPGVFVGAKQGISGGGTQATVQIDLAKGLKVEGSAGTVASTPGATVGTNSVGLIYQIEY